MSDLGIWHVINGAERRRGRTPRLPPTAPVPRFPGDPGPGKLYHGAALHLTPTTTIAGFEASNNVKLGVYRRFYQYTQLSDLLADAAFDLSQDRLPWVSMKAPLPWSDVAAGAYDSWLQSIAAGIAGLSGPVWFCLNHEPRGDGPAADFVAMYDHAAPILHQAPNLCLTSILNGYSFTGGDPDPRVWYTDGADIIAFDRYNEWWTYDTTLKVNHDGAADKYRPWSSAATVFSTIDVIQSWGKPTAIAEYGLHYAWQEPGKSKQWLADAYNYALAHGAAAISYFNSDQNAPRGAWFMDKYYKPPDWTLYADSERMQQFIADNARSTSITVSRALR
jgi:hypothetical protein